MTTTEFFNNISMEDWIKILGLGFLLAGVVVNLTPTQKDNEVLAFLKSMFDYIIPNIKVAEKRDGEKDFGFHQENLWGDIFDIIKSSFKK